MRYNEDVSGTGDRGVRLDELTLFEGLMNGSFFVFRFAIKWRHFVINITLYVKYT